MGDPIRHLKLIPWQSLFEMAALTVACLTGLEFVLSWVLRYSTVAINILSMLYAPPLGLGMITLMGMAVGAFAVYLTEKMRSYLVLNTSVLWALILCLLVTLWLKSLLVSLLSSVLILPNFLLPLSQLAFVGILVGVFWKGRRYWQ